jgi:hypothetical protein
VRIFHERPEPSDPGLGSLLGSALLPGPVGGYGVRPHKKKALTVDCEMTVLHVVPLRRWEIIVRCRHVHGLGHASD